MPVTEEQLKVVAEESKVLEGEHDFLSDLFRRECERHIQNIDNIKPSEAAMAYLYIKPNINLNRACNSSA